MAIHLEGGNLFDDIRINLPKSYNSLDRSLSNIKKSFVRNYANLVSFYLLKRLKLWNALVHTGFSRSWFDEFSKYWQEELGGRPITIQDFHNLYFHYRRMNQESGEMTWGSAEQHIHNWQHHHNLDLTFHYILSEAEGLDTPKGIEDSDETLRFIDKHFEILEGSFSLNPKKHVGFCVGRKR